MARGILDFKLSHVFPEHNGERKPFPKQLQVIEWIRSGATRGGGVVYQGGKGSAKTLCGAGTVVWVHHKYPGTTSLIGRETYPSLCISTAKEFLDIVKRLPKGLVSKISEPSKNSYGFVDWHVGGRTYLCSLSNSDVWESANLGFAWVDEGHRQSKEIVGDLETRLRQPEGPRTMLVTTNPAGKGWLWKMANHDSPAYRERWRWIEASTVENPALPDDYHARLVSRYGLNTPAYRRWVKGESSALEGSVFTEFCPEVDDCIHVVPPFDIPQDWTIGRGLDYGIVNPTAVVWGALDPEGGWWIDRVHYAPEEPTDAPNWTVERHADCIRDIDGLYKQGVDIQVADPSIFNKNHMHPTSGVYFSTADAFGDAGIGLWHGDNSRESGLRALRDLIALVPTRQHPVSLEMGAPSLYILDRPCNDPLIQELTNLQWARPEGTTEQGRPDDVQKKNDHAYDALRYLVMATPPGLQNFEPILRREEPQILGSKQRTRLY